MKKFLLSLVIVAALVACNNSTAVKTTTAEEAYTKNLATAQAFEAAFAAEDSVKMKVNFLNFSARLKLFKLLKSYIILLTH